MQAYFGLEPTAVPLSPISSLGVKMTSSGVSQLNLRLHHYNICIPFLIYDWRARKHQMKKAHVTAKDIE
jgi:hypothetical protein